MPAQVRMFASIAASVLVCGIAVAADAAADLAAVVKFDREVRGQLMESQGRHRVLRTALAGASYEETVKLIAAEEAKDRNAARAVERIPVPSEPREYAAGLENAKRQAIGALEARSDRNDRLAAAREKAYAAFADGIIARLRERR